MNNEELYFDTLRRIAAYQSVDQLRHDSEHNWGLPFEEALEMAYENVIQEAKSAVHGRRRPKAGSDKA